MAASIPFYSPSFTYLKPQTNTSFDCYANNDLKTLSSSKLAPFQAQTRTWTTLKAPNKPWPRTRARKPWDCSLHRPQKECSRKEDTRSAWTASQTYILKNCHFRFSYYDCVSSLWTFILSHSATLSCDFQSLTGIDGVPFRFSNTCASKYIIKNAFVYASILFISIIPSFESALVHGTIHQPLLTQPSPISPWHFPGFEYALIKNVPFCLSLRLLTPNGSAAFTPPSTTRPTKALEEKYPSGRDQVGVETFLK